MSAPPSKNAKKRLAKLLRPKRKTLNELLVLHLAALSVLGLLALTLGGPFRVATFIYAIFGWLALRLWNRRAWRKHFRPRTSRTTI
jgi:hypothetical protein